ncbi:MAG: HAMP domain-containing histidine kinase [Hyphomicrobiales bacterium]|nr:HAMP domain-containing histidine kinase [Hyphomicrobiales bacterium]MDE2114092.1 sensor histidine kinase [Hyphomicrobiales bacterium]
MTIDAREPPKVAPQGTPSPLAQLKHFVTSRISPPPRTRLVRRARLVSRRLTSRFSSSLTRRIIFLNLSGLVALLLGFLYLNQLREGLIVARAESLQTQASIIAATVASTGSADADTINLDPSKLLQLAQGQSDKNDDDTSLAFSINPEKVGPLLARVLPPRTRARIYDRDGYLLVDSRALTSATHILRFDLPSVKYHEPNFIDRWWRSLLEVFYHKDTLQADDVMLGNGLAHPEVSLALAGTGQSLVHLNSHYETIISVAVPIERFRKVRGALLLSTQGGDIDAVIASERWAIFRLFLVSAAIMTILSFFLAGTIAEPIRRLAEAADRVRRGTKSRQEIPDYSDRSDEIGHLSGALRDMTRTLYNRIEAIETFAADVAHELKNPLTSLRSAVETMPMARNDAARERLLAVIQHDVSRLDRLISDISNASRLDAELARADTAPVDLTALLKAVVSMANQVDRKDGVRVLLDIAPGVAKIAHGHDSRLAQVFNNLIDNARSFSVAGGSVRVALREGTKEIENVTDSGFEIIVDDDGPGIPDHALERIFERFYTDRPEQGFGQNSGLGLSISRQIVEAHDGFLIAVNRRATGGPSGSAGKVLGARFIVWLPSGA